MEQLLVNIDWRTAGLTVAVTLAVVLIFCLVRSVVRWISDVTFTWKQIRMQVHDLVRDVKVIKNLFNRYEIMLNRETTGNRMSIPPPLPLSPTPGHPEDWEDNFKKTQIRADTCLPDENR